MADYTIENLEGLRDVLTEFVDTVLDEHLKTIDDPATKAIATLLKPFAPLSIGMLFGLVLDLRKSRMALESIAKSLAEDDGSYPVDSKDNLQL